MKTLLTAAAIIIATYLQAQPYADAKVGLSSWLMPTATIDAGVHMNGPFVASTATWQGFTSVGIIGGYQVPESFNWAGVSLFGGWSKIGRNDKQQQRSSLIIGAGWKDPQGRGVLDMRYAAGTVQFTMGLRIGG